MPLLSGLAAALQHLSPFNRSNVPVDAGTPQGSPSAQQTCLLTPPATTPKRKPENSCHPQPPDSGSYLHSTEEEENSHGLQIPNKKPRLPDHCSEEPRSDDVVGLGISTQEARLDGIHRRRDASRSLNSATTSKNDDALSSPDSDALSSPDSVMIVPVSSYGLPSAISDTSSGPWSGLASRPVSPLQSKSVREQAATAPSLHPVQRETQKPGSGRKKAPQTEEQASEGKDLASYTKRHVKEERAARNANASSLRAQGWKDADISIFRTLTTLTLQPLLPCTWVWDFRIFPEILFTTADQDHTAAIRPSFRNKHYLNPGVKSAQALGTLFELGGFARDGVKLGRQPHTETVRLMRKYATWIWEEADLVERTDVPCNLIIMGGSDATSPVDLQNSLTLQFRGLEEAWRARLGRKHSSFRPPLYGVICSGLKYGILSYAPEGNQFFSANSPDRYTRSMIVPKWDDKDMDVWNGFYFALLVAHCRDLLLDMIDKGMLDG